MKLKTISLSLVIVKCLEQDVEVAPLSDAIVSTIKESFETRRSCSALSVCFDGTDYWLFDGYHRLAAMKQAGFNTCEVKVYRGSRTDAFRRYIRDKLKSKHHPVFKHCLGVIASNPAWLSLDRGTLSKLFDRKPPFFEKLALLFSEVGPCGLVKFARNKHGTYDLVAVKARLPRQSIDGPVDGYNEH